MNNPANQETAERDQQWLAQAIALDGELTAKREKLKDEMHSAERLHLKDLIEFAEKTNSQTQRQLTTTQQQNQRLQQRLQKAEQELEEYHQELIATNQDLVDALKSERLTPRQAKEIAKALLTENEPSRETIVRLLNIIYGSTLKPWELGSRHYSHASPDAVELGDSHTSQIQLSPEAIHLKVQFEQLKAQFIALQSQVIRLKI